MTTQQDMTLPEITEVERLTLRPGDVLVLHLNASIVPADQAELIKERVRAIVGIPDLRVLIVARDMRVEVLEGPR